MADSWATDRKLDLSLPEDRFVEQCGWLLKVRREKVFTGPTY